MKNLMTFIFVMTCCALQMSCVEESYRTEYYSNVDDSQSGYNRAYTNRSLFPAQNQDVEGARRAD